MGVPRGSHGLPRGVGTRSLSSTLGAILESYLVYTSKTRPAIKPHHASLTRLRLLSLSVPLTLPGVPEDRVEGDGTARWSQLLAQHAWRLAQESEPSDLVRPLSPQVPGSEADSPRNLAMCPSLCRHGRPRLIEVK